MSRYVHVELDAAMLRALGERYAGLRFTLVRASWFEEPFDGDDRFGVSINVAGPTNELLRHGFIKRQWSSLPPCGVRGHRTRGFGHGRVKRLKTGELLVHGSYGDALDKIAPVFTGPAEQALRQMAGPGANGAKARKVGRSRWSSYGTMTDADASECKRLEKLLDDRVFKGGRDLTEEEMFGILRVRYPRLHEMMFREVDSPRYRAFEKTVEQEQEQQRLRLGRYARGGPTAQS